MQRLLCLVPLLALALCMGLLGCGGGNGDAPTPDTRGITVSIEQTDPIVTIGGNCQFTSTVMGTGNTAVAWSVLEAGGGAIDNLGNYTAPMTPGVYHVIATSLANPECICATSVQVIAAETSVVVVPDTFTMQVDSSYQFTAKVVGAGSHAVTWEVEEGVLGGVITENGYYTAPSTPGVYHILATSVADPSKTSRATVTVTLQRVDVEISPANLVLLIGKTQQFISNTAVTWSVVEPYGGSINDVGLYMAPDFPGTYHVRATSTVDPTKTATCEVIVREIVVQISPSQVTINPGERVNFDATVTGTSFKEVRFELSGMGTITPDGVYTASMIGFSDAEMLGTHYVYAISLEDPSVMTWATIKVEEP